MTEISDNLPSTSGRRQFTPGATYSRPDWVMCGMPQPGGQGVRVIASKNLSYSELELKAQYQNLYLSDYDPVCIGRVNTSRELTLKVSMLPIDKGDVVIIEADDYGTAMSELFRMWSPSQQKEIEA